jgi:hypothetical protein
MAAIPSGTKFLGVDSSLVDLTERKDAQNNSKTQYFSIDDIQDSVGGSDLVFVASISQSGTSNPVTTVYKNTAGFTAPYFQRDDAGAYSMAIPEDYTEEKIHVTINNGLFTSYTFASFDSVFDKINVLTIDGEPSDDLLVGATIKIELF